jgi:hypothetical protein
MRAVIEVTFSIILAYFGTQFFSLLCFKLFPEDDATILSIVFAIILGLSAHSIVLKLMRIVSPAP